MKGLVDEVKDQGNVILFIDEVHNLVGTGDSEGQHECGNILKPALSRGEIQVIGATTFTEYRKFIEKDAALERRFQPVKIESHPWRTPTKCCWALRVTTSSTTRCRFPTPSFYKAVLMSERYVTDRYLPDKAIDLLDETCSTPAPICATRPSARRGSWKAKNGICRRILKICHEPTEEDQQIDYELISKLKTEVMAMEKRMNALQEEANTIRCLRRILPGRS